MTTETNKGPAFSLFNAPITNKYPTAEIHLKDIFDHIISGKAAEETACLRSIADKALARAYKATHFNYATFSGIFRSRADRELIRHSGLICIDFDHLPCPETTRNRLLEDSYFETQLLFTSPSGDGLKWIIPIDIATAPHADYFRPYPTMSTRPTALKPTTPAKISAGPASFHTIPAHTSIPNTSDNMNKKIFNPQEWLQSVPNHSTTVPSRTPSDDIETVTSRIETSAIDIAPTYAQWRDLGFALSDHLGEAGRSYYHRISRFHPDYTQENTDSQYDRCVRAHGSGITIKTFFQLAKEAGIQVSTRPDIIRLSKLSTSSPDKVDKPDNVIMPEKEEDLPTFSDKVHDHLPEYLKKIVAVADNDKDADILLLGSLTALSASCSSLQTPPPQPRIRL